MIRNNYIELKKCVAENNIASLKAILDYFGIGSEGTEPFTDEDRVILSTLLTHASVHAKNDAVEDEFASELVKRVAPLVNIYDYLGAILLYLDYKPTKDSVTPHRLLKEMQKRDPDYDVICAQARAMNRDQFLLLSTYIVDDGIPNMPKKCNASLLLFTYRNYVIPRDACLAYMATNLIHASETIPQHKDNLPLIYFDT